MSDSMHFSFHADDDTLSYAGEVKDWIGLCVFFARSATNPYVEASMLCINGHCFALDNLKKELAQAQADSSKKAHDGVGELLMLLGKAPERVKGIVRCAPPKTTASPASKDTASVSESPLAAHQPQARQPSSGSTQHKKGTLEDR